MNTFTPQKQRASDIIEILPGYLTCRSSIEANHPALNKLDFWYKPLTNSYQLVRINEGLVTCKIYKDVL
jgi:hypothetical protein